jgi:hypothetical protein
VLRDRGEPTDHREDTKEHEAHDNAVYKKLFVIFAGLHGFVNNRFSQLGMLQVKICFCLERMREQQDFLITEKLARQVQRGW